MTTPTPGRPGQSVNPGGDFQISSSFNQLVQSIEGLQQTIATQVSVMERQANAQARYAATSLGTLPQVTDPALQRLQQAGGAGPSLAGPTSQVPGLGALSSLQGLQTFTSRRLGNWLAGTPAVHSGWGDPAGHVQLSRCPGWCGRAASQRRLCCRSGFSVVLGGICAIGAAAALQGGLQWRRRWRAGLNSHRRPGFRWAAARAYLAARRSSTVCPWHSSRAAPP
jgi:hypothetical protein